MIQFVTINKRFSVASKSSLNLGVAQEVAEVDMEELTRVVVHHVVAWVAISDAEHVGSDALASK